MTTWTLDPAHTQVNFSAKHMMVSTVRGTFHDVTGTIEIDEVDPTRSRGEFRVAAASLDTNFDARDNHLRSADFFDAANHPYITFRTTSVVPDGKDRFQVTGDLTIKDVTAPATFEVELEGIVPGFQGGRHIGMAASGKLLRETWGLNWNVALESGGWLVGKEIKLEFAIAADEAVVAAPELASAAS
jgi:polyisoprenoid-binding protein YceI